MTRSPQTLLPPGQQPGVKDNFLGKLKRSNEAKAREAAVTVFVMGPAKQSSSAVKAAALRQELIRRCKDEGFAANAEHKDIRQQFKSLGTDVDLCTLELEYARQADVIVFVPSSHGAAAEIGYFAAISDQETSGLAGSSLVLMDKSFKPASGFVAQGPVKLLRSGGAVIKRVDLSDHDIAWRHLKRLIGDARRKKLRNQALRD